MSTEKRSFADSINAMVKSFTLNGVMVGHGGYSEIARQHNEQVKEQIKPTVEDEFSPFNTVNS